MNIQAVYNTSNFFIIGIGGSGMSSIAKYLIESGATVIGYDQRKSHVSNQLLKLNIYVTNDLSYDIPEKSLVVVSSAINIDNQLLLQAKNKGMDIVTRVEFLSRLTREHKTIGVAGTHGKTTTTALLSHIYQYNNIDSSYIFGGLTSYSGIGGHYGNSVELVLESDEAFKTFVEFKHSDLIVTNIDDDHIDHYGSFDLLVEAFFSVIEKTSNRPVLNLDDEKLNKITNTVDAITYGKCSESNYRYLGGTKILRAGSELKLNPQIPGEHFMMNALATVAHADSHNLDIEKTVEAINSFSGVKRRMELIGKSNGISVYDDYGHHPTEMDATIKALKNITTGKLYVIFQPHRYTRTKLLFNRFLDPLSKADESYILDIYSAGEVPIPGISTKILLEKGSPRNIKYISSAKEVMKQISNKIKRDDVVLTLGAGDITLLGPKIMEIVDD